MRSMIQVLIWSILVVGCAGQTSLDESIAVIERQPDFHKVLQIMNLSAPFSSWVKIEDGTDPKFQIQSGIVNMHANRLIIYETKSGRIRIAAFSATKPAQITGLSEEIKIVKPSKVPKRLFSN